MRRSLRLWLCLLFAASVRSLSADTAAGDFQRAIDHDRAFQKEMDDQRARTDAINQPSTFKPPVSQAVSAQAWLNALAEQKKLAAEANAARAREYDLRFLRAAEQAKREQEQRRAESARNDAAEAAVEVAAQPIIALGVAASEARGIARLLPVYPSGKYHIDSSPEVRATIAAALQAKAQFDARAATAGYEELSTLANRMDTGRDGGPLIYGNWKMPLYCLPFTALQARVQLLDRFKTERAANDLAVLCEQWADQSRSWRITADENAQVAAIMVRAALTAGRGERALAARIVDPNYSHQFRGQSALAGQLYGAAFARTVSDLQGKLTDPVARHAAAEAAFDDTEAMIALRTAEQNWAQVLEWHVRAFELPGFNVSLPAQAAFRALIAGRSDLLATLSPSQWSRLAAARNLAVPELLEALPTHLDATTPLAVRRNVQLNRAAQTDDRVAALTLAYETRSASDGEVEDPRVFFRALEVASAVTTPGNSAAQLRATHQARAFQAIIFPDWTNARRTAAVAEGVAAGVRESIYVTGLVQRLTATDAAGFARARELLASLGDAPLWDGRVFALTPAAQLAEAWARDRSQPDAVARAQAVRRAAAQAGDRMCQSALGVELTNLPNAPEQWKEGRDWLDRAAAAGEPSALAQKGVLLLQGRAGYAADPVAAVPMLRSGAIINRNAVPYYLGIAYASGRGVEADPALALRYWKSVRGSYQTEAALKLADAYAGGLGTPVNPIRAVEVIRPVADAGDPRAQNLLGVVISRKVVPGVAPEEALVWWRKAAAQKHFASARNLYASRVRGSPGPAEPVAALQELEAFLATAPAEAQYQGALLLLHEGPATFKENTRNEARGKFWMQQAASAGHTPAKAWLERT